jgi:galactose mutarotase-like enzyme
MFIIQNDLLSVSIKSKGAEPDSIYHKQHKLEYLWSGDPAVWGKKSPILFPIVGTLKNDTYFYAGKAYELSRHGFARESEFTVTAQSENAVSLSLKSNDETLQKFPFAFELIITYTLEQNSLSVNYSVNNLSGGMMYFSIGGHPAFKVPLVANTTYEDYYLEFNAVENEGRWLISPDGLIELSCVPMLENTNILPLKKDLFKSDALVFKNLSADHISLKCNRTGHGLHFSFKDFPFLGIWAAKNADFVCIEPWCGIADSVNTNQQLTDKEGIETLHTGELFKRTWSITLF